MKNLLWVNFFLIGCSHRPVQPTNPEINYKYTAKIEVETEEKDFECVGLCVVDQSKEYEIKVESNGQMDSFTPRSCAREVPMADVGSSEWFDFVPDQVLEGVGGFCPLWMTGLEQDRERHAFGIVLFRHERYKLEANIVCNGEKKRAKSVDFCEHREGMPAMIEFEKPVLSESVCSNTGIFSFTGHYSIGEGKEIVFHVPRGECVHFFGNEDGKFMLYTYGYTEFIGGSL